MTKLLSPHAATDVLIGVGVRRQLNDAMGSGVFVGGWMITGSPQIGKASLAYIIANALLSGTNTMGASDPTTRVLITNRGHPDLFVLEREANEKTGRLRAEIGVDAIRKVIAGLHRTSTTGKRVVIVDRADDLSREAANALLKSLEEPPAGTVMLLLSAAPGRLLPTIRSRCRRITLAPLPNDVLAPWLEEKAGVSLSTMDAILDAADGRPGRALSLATGEGEVARNLADQMLDAAERAGTSGILTAAAALSAKDADAIWPDARQLILDTISRRLRNNPIADNVPTLLEIYETVARLSVRAGHLNSDRQHTALTMGLMLRDGGIRNQNAGR